MSSNDRENRKSAADIREEVIALKEKALPALDAYVRHVDDLVRDYAEYVESARRRRRYALLSDLLTLLAVSSIVVIAATRGFDPLVHLLLVAWVIDKAFLRPRLSLEAQPLDEPEPTPPVPS